MRTSGMLALKLVLNKMSQVDWIVLIFVVIVFSILLLVLNARLTFLKYGFNSKKVDLEEEKVLDEVFDKVMVLLGREKYFLNKSIKVSHMAGELNTTEKLISKAINKHGNDNFNSFINSYRIQYAKELFNSGKYDHYTIEAIAEESGFSNKVSFYNAFKSEMGMSPKQFKALKQS